MDQDHFGGSRWRSRSAATRDAELQAQFADVRVVAVEVPTPMAELLALQQRAGDLLWSAGIEYAGSTST